MMRMLAACAGVALLIGCKREAVRSYQVPKEDYTVKVAAGMGGAKSRDGGEPAPHVHWDLPKGWEEKNSDTMSLGKFRIAGDEGKYADVSIVPIPGGAAIPNIEEQMTDMWKEQLGASASNSVTKSEVAISDAKGKLYDLTSDAPTIDGKYKARMTTAVLPKDGALWFIKMSGEASVVGAQQEAFREFLKSLKFENASHAAVAKADAEESTPAGGKWKAPEGWVEQKAGPMLLASYNVKGKAVATVSSLGGTAGGLLANVNRWRGQVGLTSPISDADLPNFTRPMTLSDGTKATAVEIKGAEKLSYTLVVPRPGQTWFYKLLGDAETVAAEKDRLAEFAATAK